MATKKKAASNTNQKYRITLMCGNANGKVTTENVGLKFKCANCGTNIEVSSDFKGLLSGNGGTPGHQLREVREVRDTYMGMS